jgi:phosphate transport system substrate-binding protein
MWQQEKKESAIASLALWLALATSPITANLLVVEPTLAQSKEAANFPLPASVENGTIVKLEGSASWTAINQSLKENFEKEFSKAKVDVGVNNTPAALKAVLDGKIDIAAIARPLTAEEKAQGLEQIRIKREKIAIIVGTNNSFKDSLTAEQFAKIFRGEITDWSELGRTSGKIRFLDRPATSDTRNALRDYPVFQDKEFTAGANAIQLSEDNTSQIIKQLGEDGISYVLAHQVSKLQEVRVLAVNNFLPDNSQYPFSQPLVYVYKKNPSPGIMAFIGFTLAEPGEKSIAAAKSAEASAIAISLLQSFTAPTTASVTSATQTPAKNNNFSNASQFITSLRNNSWLNENPSLLAVFPLFLIAGVGGFLPWWLFGRKKAKLDQIDTQIQAKINQPNLETKPPGSDAETIISAVNKGNRTNGTSHLSQGGNVAVLIPQETDSEVETNGHDPSADTSEMVWDIEAPVAVVKSPFPQIPNIPKQPKENTPNTLADSPNPPQSANNHQDLNALAEFLGVSTEGIDTEDKDKSATPLSELLNLPDEETPAESANSLSELLNLPETEITEESTEDTEEPTTSLSQILGLSAEETNEEPTTSLSQMLGLQPEESAEELPPSLSELIGLSANKNQQKDQVNIPEAVTDQAELNILDTVAVIEAATISTSEETPPPEPIAVTAEDLILPETLPAITAEEINPISTSSLAEISSPELESQEDLEPISNELPQTVLEEISPALAAISLIPEAEVEAPIISDAVVSAEENTPEVEDIQAEATEVIELLPMSGDSSIVFTPRTPSWAYVSWYVAETEKQPSTILSVRLYDVTGLDLSYQSPKLVQQYECEEGTHDRYVAIPVGDRDYITELGYVTSNNSWLPIARSGTIRVFRRPNNDLWLITDTEIIIHGSTQPGAKVSIDGQTIQLDANGKFQFAVPFIQNKVDYLLTASTPNGEQSKTVLKKFSQESSEK